MHRAIHAGLVRACHDLSEGGLAVAAAEMAFAGGVGAGVNLEMCRSSRMTTWIIRSRHYCSASRTRGSSARSSQKTRPPSNTFLATYAMRELARLWIPQSFVFEVEGTTVVDADLVSLKEAWQKPLRWQ